MSRFWRVSWSLIVVLMLGLVALVPIGRSYAAHRVLRVDNGKTLDLQEPAGTQVLIGVRVDVESVGSLWRTDAGVTLTVQDQHGVTVLDPTNTSWGDEVVTSATTPTSNVTVPATFTVPAVKGTVTGRLSGVITYPAKSGDFNFKDDTADLSVPVRLTNSGGSSGRGPIDMVSYLCLLTAIALIGCALYSVATRHRFDGILDTIYSLGAGVIIGGVVYLAGGALVGAAGLKPDFGRLPGLPFPVWTLPRLIGIAAGLGVLAWMFGTRRKPTQAEQSSEATQPQAKRRRPLSDVEDDLWQ